VKAYALDPRLVVSERAGKMSAAQCEEHTYRATTIHWTTIPPASGIPALAWYQ
jgi:hypothetical protein